MGDRERVTRRSVLRVFQADLSFVEYVHEEGPATWLIGPEGSGRWVLVPRGQTRIAGPVEPGTPVRLANEADVLGEIDIALSAAARRKARE